MNKILITGTSSGIGLATANKFLSEGFEVYGFDVNESNIHSYAYHHYVVDVSNPETFPEFDFKFDYVINNAATPLEETSIKVNLEGYINIAEKYADHEGLIALTNVGSISGREGLDRTRYSCSQGGRIALTKNLAIIYGNKYKARVNCVSFGAVLSGLEPALYSRKELVDAVANENLMKKWISCEECADWLYFVTIVNKSMTGQDILIDNGESSNYNWINPYE